MPKAKKGRRGKCLTACANCRQRRVRCHSDARCLPRTGTVDRSSSACVMCRRRKKKCDGNHPCSGCTERNILCTYEKESKTSESTTSPYLSDLARPENQPRRSELPTSPYLNPYLSELARPETEPKTSESPTSPCLSGLVRPGSRGWCSPSSPYLADVAGPNNQPGISEGRHTSAYHIKVRFDRVIEGFTEAPYIPYESLYTLWEPKYGLFGSVGAQDGLQRFHRLKQGRDNIIPYSAIFEYIDRLTVLFVTYEIDCLLVKKTKPESSSSKYDIFHDLAQRSGKSIEDLDFDFRRGQNYRYLLENGGPGSLVRMGPNVQSLWEWEMTTEEIQGFLDYRKEYLPKLEESARSLNKIGARVIIDGLLAYGYSSSELLSSSTWLIKQLRNYVDLEQVLADRPHICYGNPLGFQTSGMYETLINTSQQHMEFFGNSGSGELLGLSFS